MGSAVSCVVADGYPALLQGLVGFLGERGFDVVATATDGRVAAAKLKELRPRLALVAADLPGIGGIELVRRLSRQRPETAVVLYLAVADPAEAVAALEAGAQAVVLKQAPLDELPRAIEYVLDGQVYLDPVLAAGVVRRRVEPGELNERERLILQLLAHGLSTREIAARLQLSNDQARKQLQSAMRKLGAATRTQAVAIALRLSLID